MVETIVRNHGNGREYSYELKTTVSGRPYIQIDFYDRGRKCEAPIKAKKKEQPHGKRGIF